MDIRNVSTPAAQSPDDRIRYRFINSKNERSEPNDLTEADKLFIQQHGYIEYRRCYYFGEYRKNLNAFVMRQKSNFTMRLLFHIKRGKNKNKRVMLLTNDKGKSEVIDIETKQLASFQLFKELVEGAGHFLFYGSQQNLLRLKARLMEDEKPCIQLDTLGWNKDGFFAFSNGVIWDNNFIPVDKFGVVHIGDQDYFIPYHPGTDESNYLNEKRFAWSPGWATWEQWSKLYCNVFGDAGRIVLMFGVATLFSDHIFSIKGNFPMLFLYGEGGSGKSKMIQSMQQLWGEPQPSLKVSEKANTDKSKIRKMAQFGNAMALLEEFINVPDMALIKTYTGFYDRYGYERADVDTKYGTETIPVKSTVAFTGNEYPADDPLLQRLIQIDHNVNKFTAEQDRSFDDLSKMSRQGLTQIVLHLLKFRDSVVKYWGTAYEMALKNYKAVCQELKAPSRMIENGAVLLATFEVLYAAGLTFPFTAQELSETMYTVLKSHIEKRDTGSGTSRFWDIFAHLIGLQKIKNGDHYDLRGNELLIRLAEVHTYYLMEHLSAHRQPGLNKATLMQKLKDHPAYMQTKDSHRFKGDDGSKTSAFVFDFNSLPPEVQRRISM